MASLTYTALRGFETNGFAATGVDISVASADKSYNSVSTSLLGVANTEWILAAGFANAANNGWFQANAASLLHKITTTGGAQVNESAGPSISLTGYKRGLGQSYAIDFGVEVADRMNTVKRTDQQPMGGGAPEVMLYRDETYLSIQTGVILETSIAAWREFLASVQGGELFTFDRYGTYASPVEAKSCMLASTDYTEQREGTLYPGRYRLAFKLRVLN